MKVHFSQLLHFAAEVTEHAKNGHNSPFPPYTWWIVYLCGILFSHLFVMEFIKIMADRNQ